jgi:hypothetical protein
VLPHLKRLLQRALARLKKHLQNVHHVQQLKSQLKV